MCNTHIFRRNWNETQNFHKHFQTDATLISLMNKTGMAAQHGY